MRFIELTQGKQAKVDDRDYEWLNSRSWCVLKNKAGQVYARTRKKADNPNWPRDILMHRLIIARNEDRDIADDWMVDHINGDGLDNRKGNLRVCTKSQNGANHTKPPKGKIPYYGVYLHESGLYQAWIGGGDGRKYLGYFKTAEEAAKAYNEAAIERYGECATLNNLEESNEDNQDI